MHRPQRKSEGVGMDNTAQLSVGRHVRYCAACNGVAVCALQPLLRRLFSTQHAVTHAVTPRCRQRVEGGIPGCSSMGDSTCSKHTLCLKLMSLCASLLTAGICCCALALQKECKMWAERGECKNSKQYMMDHCKVSCKYCADRGPRPKDDVELHPLSVAAISKEVGVTSAQPGSGAGPGTAAADKALADKIAAEKAASEKAAAAAQAAAETATKAAAAAKQAMEQLEAAKAAEGPAEADMRVMWQASTLSYAALVKRYVGGGASLVSMTPGSSACAGAPVASGCT